MPRAQGRRSECGDDLAEEAVQEMELAKIQRQIRVMEANRGTYTIETNNIIRKQQSEIQTLQAENVDIRTVLKLAQSEKNELKDEADTQKLQDLLDSMGSVNKQIEGEKNRINELDNEIRKVEKQISHQRKLSGGKDGTHRKRDQQKRVRVMENRLDKSMVKFNQQLAVNTKLRQEIDHLRQDMAVFDNLYRKLKGELQSMKQEMNVLIQESSTAYEERDEAQTKMLALKERSEKDKAQHNADMKELQRIIHHDNKLKEFMMIKTQDRAEYKEEEAKKRKQAGDREIDAEVQQITDYENAFDQIREATGNEDIDQIVTDFINKEQENFAMYNYVNELNDEVEKIQEEINGIKHEIKRFEEQDIKLEEERKAMMREMEVKSDKYSLDAEEAEKKIKESDKMLDQLRVGVESLFYHINCDNSPITDILGSEDHVTEKNIVQYMGLIEQRTMEFLQMQNYKHMMKLHGQQKPDAKVQQTPPPAQSQKYRYTQRPPIGIQTPGSCDDEECVEIVEEIADHPLTQQELRSIVLRGIQRRSGPNLTRPVQSPRKH